MGRRAESSGGPKLSRRDWLRLSAADLQAIERDNALKLLPGLPR